VASSRATRSVKSRSVARAAGSGRR
jgi:hypothetical protein